MIYKMTLKDSTDEMTFNLLEVPIVDKDIEGAVDNVTLDGNQYTDYLYLKKQYIQKWSIMCDEEYERLRGFYTRQFDEAEIPTYELYYGETIYNGYTLSGEYIYADVQGVEPARMSLAQLNGNATQTTYSGKNLLSFDVRVPSTNSHMTVTHGVSNVKIVAADTVGAQYSTVLFTGMDATKTYTLSGIGRKVVKGTDGRPSIQVRWRGSNDSGSTWSGWQNIYDNVSPTRGAAYPFSGSMTGYTYYNIAFCNNAQTPVTVGETTEYYDMMLEVGSTGTSYEPYVGGIPAPNPDYPQPISIVTGENVVKVCGKNLQPTTWGEDFVTAVNDTSRGWLATEDGKSCVAFIPNAGYGSYPTENFTLGMTFHPNTQYTVSFDEKSTASNRHVAFYYTDGTYSSYNATPANTWTRVTMTSLEGKTVAYIAPFYTAGNTFIDIDTFQIELGTQATEYQAYTAQDYTISLGDLLLAKIGNYQGRIYKSGEKWYIEKQVGKVVLTGANSENWQYTNGVCFTDSISDYSRSDNKPLSDNFTSTTNVSGAGSTVDGTIAFGASNLGTQNRFYVKYTSLFSSVATIKTWLSTHPTTVYYALATPTVTEITDQTLIDQLEALVNVSIATGIHNIFTEVASGNLNPVMILNFIEVVSRRVTLVPETPVRLTLTDGGIINACGCRKDVQLTMRETIE